MKGFWSQHPWLRRSTSGVLAFLDHFHLGRVAIGGNSEQEDQPEQVDQFILNFLA